MCECLFHVISVIMILKCILSIFGRYNYLIENMKIAALMLSAFVAANSQRFTSFGPTLSTSSQNFQPAVQTTSRTPTNTRSQRFQGQRSNLLRTDNFRPNLSGQLEKSQARLYAERMLDMVLNQLGFSSQVINNQVRNCVVDLIEERVVQNPRSN